MNIRFYAKFIASVRNCPPPHTGQTHTWKLRTANYAALAGINPESAARDMLAALGTRAAEKCAGVLAAIDKSYTEHGKQHLNFAGIKCVAKPESKPAPLTAQELIRRGGGRTIDDLMAMSPVRVDEDCRKQTSAFLLALFKPDELVCCGETGSSIVLSCADWCQRFKNREWTPPLVIVNPLKPDGGRRKSDGAPSMICDDAVSVFRHAVVEFDNMPLENQVNLLIGVGLEAVTAITFSGGKSLHAVFRVDAENLVEWDQVVRGDLFRRLMVPLGCDPQCQNPARRTRLAGALREDKGGALQKLLFVREALA